jgi:murein peptide amidase A
MSDAIGAIESWERREYGRSGRGLPLDVFVPAAVGAGRVDGLLTATQHGEESSGLLLARRLLERISGRDTRWAIVPCLNPDGLLAGTRQNAAGVDLNRNFPAASWRPGIQFTYPPGIDPALRVPANRKQRSSTGSGPGSEPEAQAVMALVEELRPPLVIDLHAPLEVIFVHGEEARPLAERLGASAGLPLDVDLAGECPGAFDDWLTEQGIPTLVYEVEHAGLPALCLRHLPGLEAALRGSA